MEEENQMSVPELEEGIRQLGLSLRSLKEQLKVAKGSELEASLRAQVDTQVKALLDLKNELPFGHPFRVDERKKVQEAERQVRHSKQPHRLLPKEEQAQHRVQRKIHNMFAALSPEDDDNDEEEDEDKPFRLDPTKLNFIKTGLDFASCTILATEKWDGTTMQATNKGVFKRRDRLTKGDPSKHGASEQERYALIEIDLQHTSNRNLKRAVGPYVKMFERLPDGMTIYFEAVGPKIQSRFRDAMKEDSGLIRLFDSSLGGQFLPFHKTKALAEELGLPIVHSFVFSTPGADAKSASDVVELMSSLERFQVPYSNAPELLKPVLLEGYVFRCAEDGNKIGKLRVSDLTPLGFERKSDE